MDFEQEEQVQMYCFSFFKMISSVHNHNVNGAFDLAGKSSKIEEHQLEHCFKNTFQRDFKTLQVYKKKRN